MSRMVSRWESKRTNAEMQGHMMGNGEIHYTLIRNGRNLGQVTPQEKEEVIRNFKMIEVFNDEQEAKEEFELLGFLL